MEIWLTNNEVKKMNAQAAATQAVSFMQQHDISDAAGHCVLAVAILNFWGYHMYDVCACV